MVATPPTKRVAWANPVVTGRFDVSPPTRPKLELPPPPPPPHPLPRTAGTRPSDSTETGHQVLFEYPLDSPRSAGREDVPEIPPETVPELHSEDGDYLETLFTTEDTRLLIREVNWILDEVAHAYTTIPREQLEWMRRHVAMNPNDAILLRFIVMLGLVNQLPICVRRIRSASTPERMQTIELKLKDELMVFIMRWHVYGEESKGRAKPPAYDDLRHWTIEMQTLYLIGFDYAGRWSMTEGTRTWQYHEQLARRAPPPPPPPPSSAPMRTWSSQVHVAPMRGSGLLPPPDELRVLRPTAPSSAFRR